MLKSFEEKQEKSKKKTDLGPNDCRFAGARVMENFAGRRCTLDLIVCWHYSKPEIYETCPTRRKAKKNE